MSYIVAFRHTKEAGAYQGIIAYRVFISKMAFDEWYDEETREFEEIIEEGITEERAGELVDSVPLKYRIAAARQDATDPDGTINKATFKMELERIIYFEEMINRKKGIKNRGDSGNGMWENGWILPDGRFINCQFEEHIHCAENEIGIKDKELEKIAIKVSCTPACTRLRLLTEVEYSPQFMTMRKRMTKAQLATMRKYCVKHGFRPPVDFFTQQDLNNMVSMDTEKILIILEEQ